MHRFKEPLEFDPQKGLFKKLPLGGFIECIDREFDEGTDEYVQCLLHGRRGGGVTMGIDVVPGGEEFNSWSEARERAYQKAKREEVAKRLKAEKARSSAEALQRAWEDQRAARRDALTAEIDRLWKEAQVDLDAEQRATSNLLSNPDSDLNETHIDIYEPVNLNVGDWIILPVFFSEQRCFRCTIGKNWFYEFKCSELKISLQYEDLVVLLANGMKIKRYRKIR